MRFITLREVVQMVGVSRTTLWRMVQAGAFPRPVQITERNRGYLLDDVQTWMEARLERLPARGPEARVGLPAAINRRVVGP
jgi:prophage regulatory protein